MALLIGVPAGVIVAYGSKLWERIIIFLMIFFTCNLAGTIHFESVKDYRGTSRGFEIALVDLAALIIFFVIVMKPQYKIKLLPKGSLIYFVYLLFSILSIQNSANALYSWFEVLSMVRMYFYFWVWYNYFKDFENIEYVVKIMPVLVVYIFLLAVYQKRMGYYQPSGPFPHQNSMSMYTMTLGAIALSMLCELKMSQFKTLFILGVFGMASLIEILGLSRAGVVCYAGCCFVVLFFSFLIRYNPRKILVASLIAFVGLAGVLSYANAIYERFMYAPESSLECRKNLATSATNMANDKFFGIGLNNFGIKVNSDYPYSTHYMPPGFKEGLVESVYFMVAAETGWLNMIVFIFMLLYLYIVNLMNIFRYRKSKMLYLPIALAGGLSAVYLQSYLEWVLKQTCNYYQLMLFFAIIMAMNRLYKNNTKRPVNPPPAAFPAET
jgi:hypothetical protein